MCLVESSNSALHKLCVFLKGAVHDLGPLDLHNNDKHSATTRRATLLKSHEDTVFCLQRTSFCRHWMEIAGCHFGWTVLGKQLPKVSHPELTWRTCWLNRKSYPCHPPGHSRLGRGRSSSILVNLCFDFSPSPGRLQLRPGLGE